MSIKDELLKLRQTITGTNQNEPIDKGVVKIKV